MTCGVPSRPTHPVAGQRWRRAGCTRPARAAAGMDSQRTPSGSPPTGRSSGSVLRLVLGPTLPGGSGAASATITNGLTTRIHQTRSECVVVVSRSGVPGALVDRGAAAVDPFGCCWPSTGRVCLVVGGVILLGSGPRPGRARRASPAWTASPNTRSEMTAERDHAQVGEHRRAGRAGDQRRPAEPDGADHGHLGEDDGEADHHLPHRDVARAPSTRR